MQGLSAVRTWKAAVPVPSKCERQGRKTTSVVCCEPVTQYGRFKCGRRRRTRAGVRLQVIAVSRPKSQRGDRVVSALSRAKGPCCLRAAGVLGPALVGSERHEGLS
jgi:hypothetical protein